MTTKTLKLFLEDFKEDEEELQSNKPISNIDLAHSLALTTCSFEFECYVNVYPRRVVKEEIEDDYDYDYQDEYDDEYDDDLTKETVYYEVRDYIEEHFKTKKIKVSTKYHGIPTEFKIDNPDYWFIEYDGSLDAHYEGYKPVEIISPWVPAKDAEAFLRKFKKDVAEPFDALTDYTTGMHVNLKTKGIAINPLKLLFLFDEVDQLRKYERESSDYASPHGFSKNVVDKLQITSKHYNLKNPSVLKEITDRLKYYLDRSKKKSVNFKDYNFKDGSGRVEFRIIGNDYLNSLFKTTIESVNKFVMLMSSASDEKAHVKDLHTNFNQLVKTSPNSKPVTDTVSRSFKKFVDSLAKKNEFDVFLNAKEYLDQFIKKFSTYKLEVFENYSTYLPAFEKLNSFIDVNLYFEEHNYMVKHLYYEIRAHHKAVYDLYEYLRDLVKINKANPSNIRMMTRIINRRIYNFEQKKQVLDFIKSNLKKLPQLTNIPKDKIDITDFNKDEIRIVNAITGQPDED